MKLQSVTRSALVRSSILLSSLGSVSAQGVPAVPAFPQGPGICPGVGVYQIPYVQVYPVSISTYIQANTVFNINGNGYITINNAPTVLQTVITASTTVTSTVTSTATVSTTVTAGAGVVTPVPGGIQTTISSPILIAGSPAPASRLRKRQVQSGTFLGSSGQALQGSCTAAPSFQLTNGQLFQGSQLFSTTPGTTYALFAPSATTGSINSGFFTNNGVLGWNNTAFDGGVARFCSTGGSIYAIFRGSGPAGCTSFILSVETTSQCTGYGGSLSTTGAGNGTVSVTSPTGTGGSGSSTGSPTGTGSGTGSVSLPTGTGSVSQPTGTGSISLPTGTGSVSLPTGTGSVSLPTGTGSVSLPTGTGSTSLPTGTGSVSLPTGTGSVSLPTGTGSVSLPTGTGSSSSSSGSGTSTATTSGANPPVPSNVPATAQPAVIEFNLPSNSKRQASGSTLRYLKSDGTYTTDRSQAAVVYFQNGRLIDGNTNLPYSTDSGVQNEVFAVNQIVGGITSTFTNSGGLRWNNASFGISSTGDAQFSIVSNTLYAVFNSPPSGATSVAPSASAIPRTTSTGSSAPSSTGTGTGTVTGSTSGTGTGTGTATGSVTSTTGTGGTSSTGTGTSSTTSSAPANAAFVSSASSIISASSYTSFCSAQLGYVTAATTTNTVTNTASTTLTSGAGTFTSISSITTTTTNAPYSTLTTTTTTATSALAKRGASSTPAPLAGYNDAVLSSACSQNVQPASSTSVSVVSATSSVTSTVITPSTTNTVVATTVASTETTFILTKTSTSVRVAVPTTANSVANPGFENAPATGVLTRNVANVPSWSVGTNADSASGASSQGSFILDDSPPGTPYGNPAANGNGGHNSRWYMGLTFKSGDPAIDAASTGSQQTVNDNAYTTPFFYQDISAAVTSGTTYILEAYFKGYGSATGTGCSFFAQVIESNTAQTAAQVVAPSNVIVSNFFTTTANSVTSGGVDLSGSNAGTSISGLKTNSGANPAITQVQGAWTGVRGNAQYTAGSTTYKYLVFKTTCGNGGGTAPTTAGNGAAVFIDDIALRALNFQ